MKKSSFNLIILLIALAAFPPMSTDVYLASMPAIQRFFQASAVEVQLTLALFFLAFSLMQLVWGALSDRFGRKPVLYFGLFLYMGSSVVCAFSPNIYCLMAARFFQAVGACSAAVTRYSILKEAYTSKEAARLLGLITAIIALAPMVAPVIGTFLFVHFGWRSNFYFLALFGLAVFFIAWPVPETHQGERPRLNFAYLLSQYQQFFSQKEFMLYALTASLSFAAMFAFISSSSFVYLEYFHVKTIYFGYLFALNAFSLMVSGLLFSYLTGRFPVLRLNLIGLSLIFFGGLSMLVFYVLTGSLLSVIIPMFFATLGVGLGISSSVSLALHNIKQYAGMGSSVLGMLQYGSAAIVSVVMGLATEQVPLLLSCVVLACGAFCLCCYWLNPKKSAY